MSREITKTIKPRAKGEGSCFWCCLVVILLLFLIAACLKDLFWGNSIISLFSSSPPSQVSQPSKPAVLTSSPPPKPAASAPVTPPSNPPISAPVTPPPKPATSLLSKQPIPQPADDYGADFKDAYLNINTPKNELEVRICVRDHACEDGDIIQLSINNNEVFKGEIYRQSSCVIVPVHSGENDLRLQAINGTGGKNISCTEQINTGQVIIQSINWESAKWRLSPGESSYAKVRIRQR